LFIKVNKLLNGKDVISQLGKVDFMETKQRELLNELRSTLVGKLHVQPYIVYDDATIERLLKMQPKTLDDLKQIKGFPEKGKRFKGFGDQIIAIFNKTDSIQGFDVDESAHITSIPKKMIL